MNPSRQQLSRNSFFSHQIIFLSECIGMYRNDRIVFASTFFHFFDSRRLFTNFFDKNLIKKTSFGA